MDYYAIAPVIIRESELYHHGILGMRWGQKNGPPYPLKPSDHSASEKKAGWRKSLDSIRNDEDVRRAAKNYQVKKMAAVKKSAQHARKTAFGLNPNKKLRQEKRTADKESRLAREDLDDAVVRNRLQNETKKSKKRLQYEAEYRKKGLNAEDAAMRAYKRERTDKILKISAGVAVAALAGYALYKYRDYTIDKVLKNNVSLMRLAREGDTAVGESFYAAVKKNRMDRSKYLGMYPKELRARGVDEQQFEKVIKLGNGAKIASRSNARKALEQMVRENPQLRKDIEGQIADIGMQHPILAMRAGHDLEKGKITKAVHDAFNVSIGAENRGSELSKAYFNKLKSMGYGGVVDVNDRAISGYFAKLPLIIFDTSDAKVTQMRKLSSVEENARYVAAMGHTIANYLMPTVGAVGAWTVSRDLSDTRREAEANDRLVARYRKEHPNSELSYREIVRMNEKKK